MKFFLAGAIGLFAVLVITLLVFQVPVAEGLRLLLEGAFGDRFGVSRTLVKATPLLLTGLGATVAWKAGMYNIGGEGQYVLGGLAGAWLAKTVSLAGGPALILGVLLASMLGGAVYAWLAGWLFVRRGVEVVISTILLNFVALQFLSYAVQGPLQERAHKLPLTDALPGGAMLWKPDRQTDLHAGIFLALAAAFAIWILLFRTKEGYVLRLVGDNPRVARANRISAPRAQLFAMAVSGSLCGLAGGIEYVGVAGRLGTGFAQGWGFLGIPVALLAGLHPLLDILSALFFGALFAGSENLSRYIPSGATLIYVVQAVAVLAFVGFQAVRKPRVAAEAP